jgi:hypothetical protein
VSPPPPPTDGETRQSTAISLFGTPPHLSRPPSHLSELAGVAADPPSGEDPATPSHCRATTSVSPASPLLARRPLGGLHELASNTLPPASHHQADGECTTARGPLGCGPAGLPARRMWQAIEPRTVAAGQIRPKHCLSLFFFLFI